MPCRSIPAGSRLASRNWVVAVCAVLLVVAAALGTGGYLCCGHIPKRGCASRNGGTGSGEGLCNGDPGAGRDRHGGESAQDHRVRDGRLRRPGHPVQRVLVEAYQAAKAKVEVTNLRAAVERHNSDGSMDILVAIRTKLTNTEVQQQEQGYRLRVRMALDNGSYKIAKLDQVSK